MSNKNKKNKNFTNISKIFSKKLDLDKIQFPEIISIDKTTKKIGKIYEKYKLKKKKKN